jgi:hypothetical protein
VNKKANTLLFMLGATLFNIIITIVSFVALFLVYIRFLAPVLPEESAQWAFLVVFVGAIAIGFVVYRGLLKIITKRVKIEDHFDPLFGRRGPPKRN